MSPAFCNIPLIGLRNSVLRQKMWIAVLVNVKCMRIFFGIILIHVSPLAIIGTFIERQKRFLFIIIASSA